MTGPADGGEWFLERLHDGYAQGILIGSPILDVRTDFQTLQLFGNPALGRVLVLDGIVQTTEGDEFAYHEMLVHPALFSVRTAERVLIIGGGDGGALEEVLKHRGVRRAVMVEIDAEVTRICRQYLPSVCRDAFSDPRVDLHFGDGAVHVREALARGERFDVIIVDSSDPVGASGVLFTSGFYEACRDLLAPGGVFIAQNGVPFFQRGELATSSRRLGRVFPAHGFLVVAVPSYCGGFMTLAWGSRDGDVIAGCPAGGLDSRIGALDGPPLRYYNAGIHRAAGILPGYIAATAGIA